MVAGGEAMRWGERAPMVAELANLTSNKIKPKDCMTGKSSN